jgi:beta-phosphoglucomutase-like phosphatase (HAD superfamily)
MSKNEQAVIDDFSDEDKQENEQLNFWDCKAQKEIVGIVEVVEAGSYGGKKIGLKTNDSEEELTFIPELTALNSKLKDLVVGDKIKLVYTGEEKSKTSGRMYMTFDFFLKKAN